VAVWSLKLIEIEARFGLHLTKVGPKRSFAWLAPFCQVKAFAIYYDVPGFAVTDPVAYLQSCVVDTFLVSC
jgi:hypothetical protein